MELNFIYAFNNYYKIKISNTELQIFLTPTSSPQYFPMSTK